MLTFNFRNSTPCGCKAVSPKADATYQLLELSKPMGQAKAAHGSYPSLWREVTVLN